MEAPATAVQPLLTSIKNGAVMLDISRAKMYELIEDGAIDVVQVGGSRKLRMPDLLRIQKNGIAPIERKCPNPSVAA